MRLLVRCDEHMSAGMQRGLPFELTVLPTLHTAAVSATLHFRIRLIYGKLWKDAVADASLK